MHCSDTKDHHIQIFCSSGLCFFCLRLYNVINFYDFLSIVSFRIAVILSSILHLIFALSYIDIFGCFMLGLFFFCFATKNQTWKEQKTREFISIFYDVHLPFVCVSKEAHEFYESNMGTWIVDGLLNFCLTVQMTCCDASVSRVQQ